MIFKTIGMWSGNENRRYWKIERLPWLAGRSPGEGLWTRTQIILTAMAMPFDAFLFESIEPPVYQQIFSEANQLHRLGLNSPRIAKTLGVTDKTVTNALSWWERPWRSLYIFDPPDSRNLYPFT